MDSCSGRHPYPVKYILDVLNLSQITSGLSKIRQHYNRLTNMLPLIIRAEVEGLIRFGIRMDELRRT